MALITAIKRGIKIAGRIDRKYNLNKIFIDKYAPPHWRKPLHRLVDISANLAGGYGLYQYLNAPDSPGNSAPIPYQKYTKTDKSYKTRGRRTTRYGPKCPKYPRPYSYRRR